MKISKKTYVFMGLLASSQLAGQIYHPATECPLLKDNSQAAVMAVPAAATAPLETPAITPISTISQPVPSRLRDDLIASPPFGAPESTGIVIAGGGVATAPSRAVRPSAPYLTAELETDMTEDTPAKAWDAALSKYVSPPDATGLARFDYVALRASAENRKALDAYVQELESTDPNGLSEAEAIAYWANLYNAVTIQVVTEAYPVSSIKKVQGGLFNSGPWKKDLITVNGKKMSLDDVEHKTLRQQYPSPLIHYMVNCASVGCPNLKDGLWSANTLDADREAAARAYINSPRGAKITDKGLVVSSIYDWFKEDFGGDKTGVLAHLSEYAEGDLKAAIDGGIKISGYDYDWSLNE